jgi:hypothetical protein
MKAKQVKIEQSEAVELTTRLPSRGIQLGRAATDQAIRRITRRVTAALGRPLLVDGFPVIPKQAKGYDA